jgi:hypothetical protein
MNAGNQTLKSVFPALKNIIFKNIAGFTTIITGLVFYLCS